MNKLVSTFCTRHENFQEFRWKFLRRLVEIAVYLHNRWWKRNFNRTFLKKNSTFERKFLPSCQNCIYLSRGTCFLNKIDVPFFAFFLVTSSKRFATLSNIILAFSSKLWYAFSKQKKWWLFENQFSSRFFLTISETFFHFRSLVFDKDWNHNVRVQKNFLLKEFERNLSIQPNLQTKKMRTKSSFSWPNCQLCLWLVPKKNINVDNSQ